MPANPLKADLKMKTLSRKSILLLIALISFAAVGIALVSQYVYDMPPCAWCVFQRLIYLILGVVCLVGALGTRTLSRISAGLSIPLALGGIVAAWYQFSVAAEMESCDQTFADQFMVRSGLDGNFPSLFGIFATCMDARVEVFGIEYALWSLALFALLTIAGVMAWRRA